QVLGEIFESGPTEKPVAIINLVNDKTGLEDDHVRDHRIVDWIGVFGDVEIFLDHTPRVGEEGPMSADSGAIFTCFGDIVGADRDQPTIGDLKLTMEFDKTFSLSAVLGAEASAAKDKNHWMWSLQFGQLPVLRCVVGKLIVGEDGPWNNVGSHVGSSTVGSAAPSGADVHSHRRDRECNPESPAQSSAIEVQVHCGDVRPSSARRAATRPDRLSGSSR